MTQPAFYGSCLATLPNAQGQLDLTPDMQMATGFDVLAQSLVRRQTTPRGSVLSSPNECIDIRAMLLSKGISQAQLGAVAQTIRTELKRDQRVLDAAVSIALDTTNGATVVTETVQTAAGPFTLTLTLSPGNIAVVVAGQ